jgi:hypothetical protein
MSDQITDTGGAPLIYINLTLEAAHDSVVIVGRVPCRAHQFLTASPSLSAASVLARRTGSGDPFVDLGSAPVDLTPYDGTTVSFDFKVRAAAVTGFERVALPVRVSFNP